jgi:hypothetical protein
MLTFKSPELTHTCCQLDPEHPHMLKGMGREQKEVIRIHDEEAIDLDTLETLMEDFTAKFTVLGIVFEEFITGYWREQREKKLYQKN